MLLYCSIIFCNLFSFEVDSHERAFQVKSYETPLKRRNKIEPHFLAYVTPTASELMDFSFGVMLFVDAPPTPRFVDVVHAFNGVVVEQLRKRLEKLGDSLAIVEAFFQNSASVSKLGRPTFSKNFVRSSKNLSNIFWLSH